MKYEPKQAKNQIKTDRHMLVVRYSPDGKLLAAGGSDGTVRRWNADDLTELPPLKGHGGWVQCLAFYQDGKRLFSADSWGKLCCWTDQEKPQWSENAHDGWIRAIALSTDGKTLASAGRDRMVRLWSTDSGKKIKELPHPEDVFAVAFHPDGTLVSGDFKGKIRHWEFNQDKCRRELDAGVLSKLSRLQDVGGVRCFAFDAAGKTLAAAGTTPKGGGNVQGMPTILLYDWSTGKLKHTLNIGSTSDGFVFDLHYHTAGFLMGVTSGNPGTGKFFFFKPDEKKPFFLATKMANCHSLAPHPSGKRLIVAATNAGSNGNGRRLKNNEYPGNYSPLVVWDM